ncbi:family 43 glycosylhydrolase [Sphingobacterium phlebotomi]|uniref:Family 43 glycosylhydrolase n=1 Tax=Sphingobacterium phlebotomi TaxID=2605433 RepID=A0A5D4HE56_9SPHI|nr:glycoside hydrolase family 43 protein [Sphingobacterium phlebotomi]TYR37865.1 family 43 glycosylhydrolase [Sphingobacterium phlebotomi]
MNKLSFTLIGLLFTMLSCNSNRTESQESQEIPESQDNKTAVYESNNPLDVAFGDPFIVYDDESDMYYMYGTGGVKNGFMAYSSKDLKTWEKRGQVYSSEQEKAWGTKDFWAPEVYKRNGKYYMFYSAHWKNNPNNELENYKIGVAVSDSPVGPFIDMTGEPLFDPGYPIIDANVYFAEDGKLYLYYSRCCYKHAVESEIADWAREKKMFNEIEESWIYGVELAADFSSVIGEPALLLRPPVSMSDQQAEWESRSVTSGEVNRRWTEGSYLFKHNDTYYMMYSANFFGGQHYAVGYATASSPLGPFEKSETNPILQKNTESGGIVSGTGHNSLLKDREGKLWCVYHGRTNKTGDDRLVFLDELQLTENGELKVNGPTVKADEAI